MANGAITCTSASSARCAKRRSTKIPCRGSSEFGNKQQRLRILRRRLPSSDSRTRSRLTAVSTIRPAKTSVDQLLPLFDPRRGRGLPQVVDQPPPRASLEEIG